MLVGTFVVSKISSQTATWIALITLLSIHLGTNYLAVRSVTMRTLNRQRANLVISSLLEDMKNQKARSSGHPIKDFKITLPSPKDISPQERIFEQDGAIRVHGKVLAYCKVGISFSEIISALSLTRTSSGNYIENDAFSSQSIISNLVQIFKNQGYIMWYSQYQNTFLVVLKAGTSPKVQLDAWFHAVWTVAISKRPEIMDREGILGWMETSLRESERWREDVDFYAGLEGKGWDLGTAAVEVRAGCRVVLEEEGKRGALTGL